MELDQLDPPLDLLVDKSGSKRSPTTATERSLCKHIAIDIKH